jgi:hypothetical protein
LKFQRLCTVIKIWLQVALSTPTTPNQTCISENYYNDILCYCNKCLWFNHKRWNFNNYCNKEFFYIYIFFWDDLLHPKNIFSIPMYRVCWNRLFSTLNFKIRQIFCHAVSEISHTCMQQNTSDILSCCEWDITYMYATKYVRYSVMLWVRYHIHVCNKIRQIFCHAVSEISHTFNNISVISWRSALLVEEIREIHLSQTTDKLIIKCCIPRPDWDSNISGDRHWLHR